MKNKIYLLLLMASFSMAKSQTPELLYYKFEGTASNVPNLATSPPAGTQIGEIVGNLTLGSNTTCLGNGLVGSGSTGTNYFNTKWNLALSGSWTIHLKFNNYASSNTTVYYLLGDAITGGNSFRMFTNGAPGTGGLRLTANGMSNVDIPGVFSTTSSLVDLIFVYDSSLQNIKAYLNGVLKTTVAQSSPLVFNGALFKLGAYATNTGMKAGMTMDEFGLFNRAITDMEIASLNNFCSSLSTNEVTKSENSKIAVKNGNLILGKGNFGKYSIYDFTGREILAGDGSSNSININSLQKGVYIIKYGENISTRFKY
ncbi:LamG-like jellyroll fold domain-containing protein [Chryseobacterium indoltheticum]|uniref:LamG-like jellyroll fold domain-containing protein n=1 Tax=Chryseobacterium indoltheticum TaxID=254 RepID=UPI001912EABC|nr:LamG-like jellyroll fold domain-containing protein [Chryseobacterium indoltheticum]QQQ27474.1 T9SS type A sorting domain-containing protein [Chryseobacterium indoltheticum]